MSIASSLVDMKSISPLDAIFGRIRDVDTHEMYPARLWEEEFGEVAKPFADLFVKYQPENVPNSLSVRKIRDEDPITAETLDSYWTKGCLAAGAFDMNQRLKFMDVAGFRESFVFGNALGLTGWQLATGTLKYFEHLTGLNFGADAPALGRRLMKAHNDWCIRVARVSPRLRPVGCIVTQTLTEAIEESERLAAGGVKAVSFPSCLPIEGRAPSHPANDPLWKFFADSKMAALLHIGGEAGFLADKEVWLNAPLFASNVNAVQAEIRNVPMELTIDPVSFATCHISPLNYVVNLVLGGVFERVPELRFGVMELGAHWVGPMAENLDMWIGQFARRYRGILSMKPSDYIQRNIRVTPFNFEPVDKYIERHPKMSDVMCFSSDYPHQEGGQDPRKVMLELLGKFGADTVEKFFVTNAEWVMPA